MISSLLPKPKHSSYEPPTWGVHHSTTTSNTSVSSASRVLVLSSESATSNLKTIVNPHAAPGTVQELLVQPDGTLDYAATLASGSAVQSTYLDTVSLKRQFPNLKHSFPRYDLETCPDDSLKQCVVETQNVIDGILKQNTTNNNYNNNSIVASNSDRIVTDSGTEIAVATYREDPLLPPRFKLRKNRHVQLDTPPAPVLKKTDEAKITKEDREKWKIPAAVSNWKNNMGFTIAIDKRMQAAHGGTGSSAEVNIQKFAQVSDALQRAEKEARDELNERRALMRQKDEQKQRERDLRLRQLAEEARKRHRDDDRNVKRRR